MGSYEFFARVYDRLTDNVGYRERADFIHSLLSENGVPDGALAVDLACGTGSLTLELAKSYDMIGVDISEQMLSAAMEKAYEASLNVLFLRQDITRLDLYGTVKAAVCTLDSLNHLSDGRAVEQAIFKAGLFMEPGGVFIFDVNTVYKHRNILADNTFVYDCGDIYCVWQNTPGPDDSVRIDLDIFEEAGGLYARSSESFTERAYPLESYAEWLKKAEFEIIDIYDSYTRQKPCETTQRAVFAARYAGKPEAHK